MLKPAIIEETFMPGRSPGEPAAQRDPGARIPPLTGYVATTPSPRHARTSRCLQAGQSDPVAWQYGLGKSVAFMSDAKNRWAAPWVSRPAEYRKFWAQMIRWTVRTTSRTNLEANVEIARRKGKVAIDALDNKGDFLNFLDLKGNVVSPKMRSLKLERQRPGRYEELEAPEVGQYIPSLGYKDRNGRQKLATAGTAVPYSEYRELQANEATLLRLAEVSHGRVFFCARREVAGRSRPPRLPPRPPRRDRAARTLAGAAAARGAPLPHGRRHPAAHDRSAEALAYFRLLARLQARLSPRSRRRVGQREEALSRLLAAKEAATDGSLRPATPTPDAPRPPRHRRHPR